MNRQLLLLAAIVLPGICFSLNVSAQSEPKFSASVTSGCAPLVVTFTDETPGDHSVVSWDLGNGTISSLTRPSATYFNPGSYKISLTIKKGSDIISTTQQAFIIVHAAPQVDFSADNQSGCYPLPVRFTDKSQPGTGTLTDWLWDFGDGQSQPGRSASHIYTSEGNSNVSLRVKNSAGCIASLTLPSFIRINDGVTADFSIDQPYPCRAPAPVQFRNHSTGKGILAYTWNFADGTPADHSADPIHTFMRSGSYSVTLTTVNERGCSHTITYPVTIGAEKADFRLPPAVCINEVVPIQNTSSQGARSILWEFDDGTSSPQQVPDKTFDQEGKHQIRLRLDFGYCSDERIRTVDIIDKPVFDFTTSKPIGCKSNHTTGFKSSIKGASAYLWKFGDGETSTEEEPQHIYRTEGEFTVELTITNSYGCQSTLIKDRFVQVIPPKITLKDTLVEACLPYTYRPEIMVGSIEPITAYSWDFGDGGLASGRMPAYMYTNRGFYNVKLNYTTQSGCEQTITFPRAVHVGYLPAPDFEAEKFDACAFEGIQFFDRSIGDPIDDWIWDFGKSVTVRGEKDPKPVFRDTGLLDIRLTAISSGCRNSVTKQAYIHSRPAVSNFFTFVQCEGNPYLRRFTDASLGATSISWDFGDGTILNDVPEPEHIFKDTGEHIIHLRTTNGECSYDLTANILILDEPFSIKSEQKICPGTQLTFSTPKVTIPKDENYNWTRELLILPDTLDHITQAFPTPGTFRIAVSVRDAVGCERKAEQLIRVGLTQADFRAVSTSGCVNSPVLFEDLSITDPDFPITKWVMDYGDGSIESGTIPSFKHVYQKSGIYTVTLSVINNAGCESVRQKMSYVSIGNPIADFPAALIQSCPGKEIQLENTSTGNGLIYTWDLGNGTLSHDIKPLISYTADGIYTVSLLVEDPLGCRNSLKRDHYIRIKSPVASFTVSETKSNCPPLVVTFQNHSSNGETFEWDFGDQTSTTLSTKELVHFYTYPGSYQPRLKVTAIGGCTEEIQPATITIKGPKGSLLYETTEGCTPVTVNFIGTASEEVSYTWDFNDGAVVTSLNPEYTYTYKRPGEYLPRMILKNKEGCQVPVIGEQQIRVFGVTANFHADRQLLCDKGLVNFLDETISNDRISTRMWDFGDGTTSTTFTPEHFYTNTGKYPVSLVVETDHHCMDRFMLPEPIKVAQSPAVAIDGPQEACQADPLQFFGHLTNSDTSRHLLWQWTFSNGSSSDLQDAQILFQQAGLYNARLVLTNSDGCTASSVQMLTIHPTPLLKVPADFVLCRDASKELPASGGQTYSWTPAGGLSCSDCATPIASPETTTQYIVQARSAFGCQALDSVVVTVQQKFHVSASAGDTLCIGESYRLNASGADLYAWSPATNLSDPAISNPTATPGKSTVYQVTGMDKNHCFRDTAYVPVVVYPFPVAELGPDQTLIVGTAITLKPQLSADITYIKWYPALGLDCIDCPTPVARPRQTVTYHLEVRNQGGCKAQDAMTVFVVCKGDNIFLPNTFSPDNNGVNDTFFPRGKGLAYIKRFQIFNRWGELVFERRNFKVNEPDKGWDGSYKGHSASPDVYVYSIDVACENNEMLSFKGDVSLIR